MKKFLPWLAAGCAALIAIGCGGTSDPIFGGHSPRVRLVDAVYGTTDLSANIQSTDESQRIGYSQATDYKIVENVNQNVSLTDPNTQAQYGLLSNQLFENGRIYTVIGTGYGTAGQESNLPTAFVIEDTDKVQSTQSAQVRVVNAARGSDPIDVWIAPAGTDFGSVPTRANLTFGSSGNTATYSSFQPGQLSIRVTASGTSTVLLNKTITIPTGSNNTLVITYNGTSAGAGYDAFAIQDAPAGGYH